MKRLLALALAAPIAVLAQEQGRVPGDGNLIVSLAFTPDGRSLAAGEAKGDVSIRDPKTGKERRRVPGSKGPLVFAGFASGGKLLVAVDAHTVTLRDYPGGEDEPVHMKLVDSFPIECAAIASGADVIALGVGRRVVVLDLATRSERARLDAPDDHVIKAIAITADGKRAVSGNLAGNVRVWDLDAKKLVLEADAAERANRLRLTADGRTVALPGRGTALLDLATGRVGEAAGQTEATASASSGAVFATGGRDGAAELTDGATGRLLATLRAHETEVRALAFSPDGRTLASVDANGTLAIFDVTAQVRPH